MTDTKPCARCSKQNAAEIHTCTPLALWLAEQLEDTESARLHLLIYVAAELRRLHAENEGLKRALRGAELGSQANFASIQHQAALKTELLEALHRANSLLAELSFSSWIPGSDAASVDMRQRILNTHRSVFDAITKVEGPVQGESVVG